MVEGLVRGEEAVLVLVNQKRCPNLVVKGGAKGKEPIIVESDVDSEIEGSDYFSGEKQQFFEEDCFLSNFENEEGLLIEQHEKKISVQEKEEDD